MLTISLNSHSSKSINRIKLIYFNDIFKILFLLLINHFENFNQSHIALKAIYNSINYIESKTEKYAKVMCEEIKKGILIVNIVK